MGDHIKEITEKDFIDAYVDLSGFQLSEGKTCITSLCADCPAIQDGLYQAHKCIFAGATFKDTPTLLDRLKYAWKHRNREAKELTQSLIGYDVPENEDIIKFLEEE